MKATNQFLKCTLIASMMIGSFQSHAQSAGAKPDLVISSFTVNGPDKTTGVTTISYTVVNRPTFRPKSKVDPTPVPIPASEGTANIGSVTVTAYWKKNGTWVSLGSKNISSAGHTTLESLKNVSGTFTTTKFVPVYSTQAGQTSVFDFQLRVDETNKVTEYDETNNTKNFQMNVPG